MAPKSILKNFLKANKGERVRIFVCTGFQLKGTLIDYDDNVLISNTNTYDYTSYTNVLVNLSAITTIVPGTC